MMNLQSILNDDKLSDLDKRSRLMDALNDLTCDIDILAYSDTLEDSCLEILLEAIELITVKSEHYDNANYLRVADKFLTHNSDSIRREALRIVGNLAHDFADQLGDCVPKIILSIVEGGVIARWSGAYALSRIISTPQYAPTFVYELVEEFYEREDNHNIKALYYKGLETAKPLRIKCRQSVAKSI